MQSEAIAQQPRGDDATTFFFELDKKFTTEVFYDPRTTEFVDYILRDVRDFNFSLIDRSRILYGQTTMWWLQAPLKIEKAIWIVMFMRSKTFTMMIMHRKKLGV